MVFFFLGLVLGAFLGIFLMAMVVKSKELDEKAFRSLEEKDGVSKEYVPVTSRSII
jgi:hypothetical protein